MKYEYMKESEQMCIRDRLNMLKAHSEEIFSCLDSYPEYFKDRLSVLMK